MTHQEKHAPLDSVKLVWIDREKSNIQIQYAQLVNGKICKGKLTTTQAELMFHFQDVLSDYDTILDLMQRANAPDLKEYFCSFLKEHSREFAH